MATSLRHKIAASSCLFALIAGCATPSGQRGNDVAVAPPPPPIVAPPPPPAPPPHQRAEASERDNIVVTGTQSQRAIQNSPISVQAVGGAVLDEASRAGAPSSPRIAETSWRYVPPIVLPPDPSGERYDGEEVSPVHQVRHEPVSTFSVDVDTGAYANARRFLAQGQLPPSAAVRTEELINYFRYDYERPGRQETPFSLTTDSMVTPWNAETRLLRIGLRGYDLPRESRPPANLVFLVDVSGSMQAQDKLPLVKSALAGLAGELRAQDKVSIVVYAGAAGLVLPATNDERQIRAALSRLEAGGSTAGGAGLELAYQVARNNFIRGGVNRILLATDGDFNVGVSNTDALIRMVERERETGITLTTLGFGEGNYNEALMEQIANHGNGNYAYIDSALEARKVLGEQMESTLFTIAKDVKIQIEFNPAQVSQYRLFGYENRALREEDFNNDRVDAGDIGAGHQVTAIYEIVPANARGWTDPRRYPAVEDRDVFRPPADRASEMAFVKLRYKLPDGATSRLVEQPIPAALMWQRRAPSADFQFATAVAAFGQKLRGDPLLAGFSYRQVTELAGRPQDFWRQEFVRLVGIAEGLDRREIQPRRY